MSCKLTANSVKKLLRQRVESQSPPLSTADKVLIVAEVLKREHHDRHLRGKPHFNDADLVTRCLELFPRYDQDDRELYLRGTRPDTMPMIRPTLLRDLVFGRQAPLKRWIAFDRVQEVFVLNTGGSVHARQLLAPLPSPKRRTSPRRSSTRTTVSAPILEPMSPVPPTRAGLRAFQGEYRRHLDLIDALQKLNCVQRPLRPLQSDLNQLLMTINRHRDPKRRDESGLSFVTMAVQIAKKHLQMLAALGATLPVKPIGQTRTPIEPLDEQFKRLDIMLMQVETTLNASPPMAPITMRYQKTGSLSKNPASPFTDTAAN